MLCNGQSSLRGIRDAFFIDGQRHHQTAVLGRQREDRLHHFLFAVDGVDERLAVIAAQRLFHSDGIRGIDLQRQIRDSLQFLHHFFHHGHFIDLRQADIDIQHIRLLLLLQDALLQDIIHIMRSQRFFKFLLAGRVDALADQDRFLTEFHGMRIRGDQRILFFRQRHRLHLLHALDHRADMRRCGTAAAAQYPGPL